MHLVLFLNIRFRYYFYINEYNILLIPYILKNNSDMIFHLNIDK